MRELLIALSVGAAFALGFFALGIVGILPRFFETLLWPGVAAAKLAYGGLHGGEPLFLCLGVNTLFYGLMYWLGLLLWISRRRGTR